MATSDDDGRPFPEDLAMGILTRLPVESLLRFKCVDKYWYETITSPSFIKEHMNWSRKNWPPKIMIYDHVGCPSNDDSPLNPNPITLISVSDAVGVPENPDYLQEFIGMTHLLGSVDGLFLLERVIDDSIFNIFLALWNPATREVRSLPSPDFNLPPSFKQHRRQFGFGLDLMTNDYKVVWFRIFLDKITRRKAYQPYAAVYSCSKDSWRILQPENTDIFLFKDCIEALGTAYLNGAYYWLLICVISNCSILSFDFGNEVFTEIEGPDAPRPFNHGHLKLILLEDSLALVSIADWDRFENGIWVMIQPGVWNKMITFECSAYFYDIKSWNPYTFIFVSDRCRLVSYDVTTRETRRLGFRHPGLRRNDYGGCSVHCYKESLVTIKRGNGELDPCRLSDLLNCVLGMSG